MNWRRKIGLAVGDSYYAYYDDAVLMGLYPMQKPIEFDFEIVGLFHVNVNQVVGEYTSETKFIRIIFFTVYPYQQRSIVPAMLTRQTALIGRRFILGACFL